MAKRNRNSLTKEQHKLFGKAPKGWKRTWLVHPIIDPDEQLFPDPVLAENQYLSSGFLGEDGAIIKTDVEHAERYHPIHNSMWSSSILNRGESAWKRYNLVIDERHEQYKTKAEFEAKIRQLKSKIEELENLVGS